MKDLNRLIAEFMDVFPRQGEERTGMKEFYSPIDLAMSGLPDELTLADDLDFNQWHWIMPVANEIIKRREEGNSETTEGDVIILNDILTRSRFSEVKISYTQSNTHIIVD